MIVTMPYEITLPELPAGYALADASGVEGTPAPVVVREFSSSEDGEHFISRLDGWPTTIVSHLPRATGVRVSQIDHLIAVIRSDRTATVYVNELPITAHARATRALESGEEVTEDDIGDIQSVDFGVEIPPTAGVLVVMSAKWRKGLFFDFGPLMDEGERTYDIQELLGSYYAYLFNQVLFSLSEDDWNYLIDQLWFPFVGLPKSLLRNLLGRARRRSDLDLLVPQVRDAVASRLDICLHAWRQKSEFVNHIPLLEHAASRFRDGDYVSTTAILYPRIEGILRDLQAALTPGAKATQSALAQSVSAAGTNHPHSWLMPDIFQRYLKEAYFASFAPGQPAKFSRNAVSHGVAAASDFNQKAAAISLLIVEQIQWFLPAKERTAA